MRIARPVLVFVVLGLFTAACPSGGDDDDDILIKCETMCKRLLGPGFRGCGHGDATSEKCVPECVQHVDDGESNAEQVDCAVRALTCEAWEKCGDLL